MCRRILRAETANLQVIQSKTTAFHIRSAVLNVGQGGLPRRCFKALETMTQMYFNMSG